MASVALLTLSLWIVTVCPAFAQGITTGAIRGTVRTSDGTPDEGARVRVVNSTTGFAIESDVRHGRFLVQGLQVGGPYLVTVRRLGFAPQQRAGLFLALGQESELDITLERVASRLEAVRIDGNAQDIRSRSGGGVSMTVSDSLLHRLPTLNRDLYDFVRLSPQVTTRVGLPGGGLSGGGVGFRFNNYLIDGASERYLTGNSSVSRGGKSISIEAVKEYQILLAPFDVRYGDFAGALINTVSRSGTNEPEARAFVYARSDRYSGQTDSSRTPYQREQFGFALSGPIMRDRLLFLVAPEFQRLTAPALGPYLGQAASASPPLPVRASDVERLGSLLRGYGLQAGSGGAVSNDNPLSNLFARVDLAVPDWNSRVVLFHNASNNTITSFSRADTFALSSYRAVTELASRLSSAQLHTSLRGGGYNELILAHRTASTNSTPDVTEPVILVAVPRTGEGTAILKAGSQEQAQGSFGREVTTELTDNLTLPFGDAHEMTFGVHAEHFQLSRGGVNASFGSWSFSSLDSLAEGLPDRFEIKRDLGGADLPLAGDQMALYVGDRWRPTKTLSVVLGIRGDALVLRSHAPYNAAVDAIFSRRTDDTPAPRIHVSPRVGFDWDVHGEGRQRLRGGVGIFTGRYPLAWAHSAIYSYGLGIGTLRCGNRTGDSGEPPHFEPNYRVPPRTCANATVGSAAPHGDVDLLSRHLRMAQTVRASLAYERQLPWHVEGTVEALFTRTISDFTFVNLNLPAPRGVDPHGRIMYGQVGPSGVATTDPPRSPFSEVIDLTNNASNHASQYSGTLLRHFSDGLTVSGSYTFSRARDVGTPLRAGIPGIVNWAGARAVSERHDDLSTGVSLYDLPHRIIVAGTYTAPWRRWASELSFYYVGESGSPFTYVASGLSGRGDLNADGVVGNDPIYIPKSALDPSEIALVGSQQSAFDALIDGTECLQHQRGRIMARNSCREPWAHTSIVSLRQSAPVFGTHNLAAQVDVFNVFNLLRTSWGLYRVANTALLEQVGESTAPSGVLQPIFRFDPVSRPLWVTLPTESTYQIQFALRYTY